MAERHSRLGRPRGRQTSTTLTPRLQKGLRTRLSEEELRELEPRLAFGEAVAGASDD